MPATHLPRRDQCLADFCGCHDIGVMIDVRAVDVPLPVAEQRVQISARGPPGRTAPAGAGRGARSLAEPGE